MKRALTLAAGFLFLCLCIGMCAIVPGVGGSTRPTPRNGAKATSSQPTATTPAVTAPIKTTIAHATPAPEPTATPTAYEVQAGDTLSAIAKRFGCTVDALAEANDIADPSKIYVGQVLVIPGATWASREAAETPAAKGTQEPQTYSVQSGDSLAKIAAELGVSVAALAAYNDISDPSRIYVGQELRIPPEDYVAPTVEPTPIPVPTATPVVHLPTPAPTTARICCKYCRRGKACGDSCINRNYTCHKAPGCACNAY